MWSHEASVEAAATPRDIWSLFSDVAGWKRWNSGIERIEIHGAFADGTTFMMQPTGAGMFTSTLVDVRENEGFTDETVVEDTRVLVHHKLIALAPARTRIIFRTEITGPGAEELGPMITGDFPDVLGALKQLSEDSAHNGSHARL